MHCDLDCFFAAVETLDDPTLAGRPVIVGGDPYRRGVVSTANYLARRYGVHSAMSAAQARRLCPHGVFLPPRFARYRELSRVVMSILDDYFTVRERVSIDEAYGELPSVQATWRPAEAIAREVKRRVRQETGLVISVGVGVSKSVAKLASDLSKPDGCLVVTPARTLDFLHPLPVGLLHGVGPRTRAVLERAGVTTAGQLASMPPDHASRLLGQHGLWLWRLANGQDERPVEADHGPPKSISRECTYERDIGDVERLENELRDMAADVARQAGERGLPARTVTLKVRWSDFRTATRQTQLAAPTHDPLPIIEEAARLLRREIAPAIESGHAVRLIGVGLSGFSTPAPVASHGWTQLPLFEAEAS
jgi:DNA polymerase-4